MGFHGAAAKILPGPVTPAETVPEPELTDGFHLVIDALKLNDIDTIYGLPGIPITDLTASRRPRACGSSPSVTSRTPATPPPPPAT